MTRGVNTLRLSVRLAPFHQDPLARDAAPHPLGRQMEFGLPFDAEKAVARGERKLFLSYFLARFTFVCVGEFVFAAHRGSIFCLPTTC
ncbi:hypothetical protein E2C01_056815 [Portunus trituberculatus]|uniref:Uncharacterized protein n=1 Tax=Portunus trituberculatus TaxID=210409 RepID=A0A5B7GZ88_PORTR|nr:hypothetical protein [Portunus trituberculatus]